jgi:hypothetical protein
MNALCRIGYCRIIIIIKCPEEEKQAEGQLVINGAGKTVMVPIRAVRYDISRLPEKTFVDTDGVIAIEAEHYTDNMTLGGGEWKVIEDYGRTLSSMKVFPVTLDAKTPGVDAPYLEYRFVTKEAGNVTVYAYGAPTNNLSSETGMKYAVAIDDEKPQVVDTFPMGTPVGRGNVWSSGVMQNCRINSTLHSLSKGEIHTLRFYMVDAGYVLQRIVIDCGNNLKKSFLGPEESYYIK